MRNVLTPPFPSSASGANADWRRSPRRSLKGIYLQGWVASPKSILTHLCTRLNWDFYIVQGGDVEHGGGIGLSYRCATVSADAAMQQRLCVVWKIKSVDCVLSLPLPKTTRKSGPFWPSSRTRCTSTSNAFDRVFPTIQSSWNDAPETRFQKTRDSFSALDMDGKYWAQPLLAFDAA